MSTTLPKDQTVNAYDKRASFYETKWQAYLDHTHEAFIRNIKTSETDMILDVSGGTGLLAQMLIQEGSPFKQFIINDPSERMLDIARQRLSSESNIRFTNYRAEEISYEVSSFDQIFCLNSFHFYSEQEDVLDRCYDMLKPGGKLHVLDWNCTGFSRSRKCSMKVISKLTERPTGAGGTGNSFLWRQ